MSGTKPTPGPWTFRFYANSDKEVAEARKFGIEPVRMLDNNGACAIMSGDGDDAKRICMVDRQAKAKRGEGYKTECSERDANARLIVRAVNCHADLVDGCNALLGLFQLLCARDDAPAWLKDAFETSHRVTEARAALAKALEP